MSTKRRPNISESEFRKALNAVLAAGRKPTLYAIQKQIGGGSYPIIGRYFDKWREQQKSTPATQINLPLTPATPAITPARTNELQAGIADIAVKDTKQHLNGERQALESMRIAMARDMDAIAERADALCRRAALIQSDVQKAASAMALVTTEIRMLVATTFALRDRLAGITPDDYQIASLAPPIHEQAALPARMNA